MALTKARFAVFKKKKLIKQSYHLWCCKWDRSVCLWGSIHVVLPERKKDVDNAKLTLRKKQKALAHLLTQSHLLKENIRFNFLADFEDCRPTWKMRFSILKHILSKSYSPGNKLKITFLVRISSNLLRLVRKYILKSVLPSPTNSQSYN